jgi:hypothetical protein
VGPAVYQRVAGIWTLVDQTQIPPDSATAQSLQQLRKGGLDGSPFRVSSDISGRVSQAGSEVIDGRTCRWFVGTVNGSAGPMQIRVALEEGRDLPCQSEAEFSGPYGRARQAVRYTDYNAPMVVEPPTPSG